MAQISRFTTFNNGQTLSAVDLEGEFNELQDALRGTSNREIEIHSTGSAVRVLTLNAKAGAFPASFEVDGVEKARVNELGQIESVLATGTAPLKVASTTLVANLNAESLGGAKSHQYARSFQYSGTWRLKEQEFGLVFQIPNLQPGATGFSIAWSGAVILEDVSVNSTIEMVLERGASNWAVNYVIPLGTTRGTSQNTNISTLWTDLQVLVTPQGGDWIYIHRNPSSGGFGALAVRAVLVQT